MEYIEATPEDYRELQKFIRSSAINSLRLLLNNNEERVSRTWLKRHGISTWVEEELDNMGMIVMEDESSVSILKDNISEFLKNQSANCKEQMKLEG